ncbi:MAG: esterase/lipase family protein [Verrucomicrobiales bacterium]
MKGIGRFLYIVLALPFLLSGCSTYSKSTQKSASALTVTAEQRDLQKTLQQLSAQPMVRLGVLLDAVEVARQRLAESPGDALIQSNYNFAVSRIVEIVETQNLTPWEAPVACRSSSGREWSLGLVPPDPRPEYHPSNFEILPADRYDFKGTLIGERSIKQGLGAPVIAVGKDLDFTKIDQFALGKRVFYGLTAIVRCDGSRCDLVFLDPLSAETVQLDQNSYPLAADFQAALALSLAEMNPRKSELAGMFSPSQNEDTARLSRLQAYDPNKIPVLLIHGLGDSRATWMPMVDTLRNDEVIRQSYQFWCFSYPTGLPYPLSASILRNYLDQFSERYQGHKDIVVIGHSMGGMISRLLITDSGMTLWNGSYDKPPEAIPFSEETRRVVTDALIFKARPKIGRVIYASASHRGSDTATNFFGRLGSKMIGAPISETVIDQEAMQFARRDTEPGRRQLEHLPNSIDILDPENRFLKLVDTLPPKPGIPYHSIIGDRGKGGNLDRTKPVSTDGIVPYWSSHLDGAVSEVIVPSGHWSIHHPRGIAETQKILIHHLTKQ